MGTKRSDALVSTYSERIGIPSTADEAYGYWVFVLGVFAGFLGIALVLLSDSPGETVRGAGIALAAVGLLLLLIGPTIRLPLKRKATLLSYVGTVIGLVAVGWFLLDFLDGNWGAAFNHNEALIIALYGLSVFTISLGSVFVPLLTSPREQQLAAESRATSAESERDVALAEAEEQAAAAEERAREADAATEQAEQATEQAKQERAVAATERSEREALERELAAIAASQSQFELYSDRSGKHRWRLRHRNRNIIADSSQGYSSRQKAQQGLNAVRRDAVGAGVVDLDRLDADIEIEEVDDASEGEEAPAFIMDVESNATFETYEDKGGKYRWRLVHDNGNIIADSSQGYTKERNRDEGIERVKQYVQSADYLRVDPTAFEIYRDRAGKYRWRLLHRNGNILADSGQGYASRQKAKQGVSSVAKNAPAEENATFEVYEDSAGEYRWRLNHRNGNIIADSGGSYSSKRNARDAVERVKQYAPETDVLDIGQAAFEIYKDKGDAFRWRLRHRNGNILSDSGEGYASRSGVEKGINSVKQNAPNAEIERVEG